MGLVKTVTGKLFHQIKDFHGQSRIDTFTLGTLGKNLALFGHLFGFFLTHRPAQQVGAAQAVARQLLRDLHDLFLVNNNPVGGL